MLFNGKKLLQYVTSFSKIITIVWLCIWVETTIFSQIITILQIGDTTLLQTINDNVLQLGLIICGFYFCTKTVENVAKGVEYAMLEFRERECILSKDKKVSESEGDITNDFNL